MINWLIRFVFVFVLVLVWGVLENLNHYSVISGPVEVFKVMREIVASGEYFIHAFSTLYRSTLSFLIASSMAIMLGFLAGRSKRVESAVDVPVYLMLSIPSAVWVILSLIWFGLGDVFVIVTSILATTPFLVFTMLEGVKDLDKDYQEVAEVFKLSKIKKLRKIILPQLWPFIFSILRYGFAIAWKIVVLAEVFGLNQGIGYKLSLAFDYYSTRQVLAWSLLFAANLYLIELLVFRPIQKRLKGRKDLTDRLSLGVPT